MFINSKQEKYYITDNKVSNINIISGLRFATPKWGNFGAMAKLEGSVNPIPYDVISYEKIYSNHDKEKSKFIFNHFNPSYFASTGIFYDYKRKSTILRITLGYSITNYNPYNTYYHAKIEGVRLRDFKHLSTKRMAHTIFLSFNFLSLDL